MGFLDSSRSGGAASQDSEVSGGLLAKLASLQLCEPSELSSHPSDKSQMVYASVTEDSYSSRKAVLTPISHSSAPN